MHSGKRNSLQLNYKLCVRLNMGNLHINLDPSILKLGAGMQQTEIWAATFNAPFYHIPQNQILQCELLDILVIQEWELIKRNLQIAF